MAKLSDLQVAMLLEEIACAMRVGSPVLDSMRRLKSRRLGRVGRVAGQIAARLERGEDLSDALVGAAPGAKHQAAAAISAAKTSGDPGLIDRMALQLRQRASLASDTRIAWFYPWVLLFVGYVIAVVVMAPMIRRLDGPGLRWPREVVAAAMWLESNWWIPPIAVVGLVLIYLLWSRSWKRFSRPARLGIFCNSLADQVAHDVPEDVAISAAAEISGDEELMSIGQPTLASPEVMRAVSAGSIPADPLWQARPQDSGQGVKVVEVVGGKQTLIARLRYAGSLHTQKARTRSYIWSRLAPRVAMVLVGGGLTLSYALWVIAPVYLQVAQW